MENEIKINWANDFGISETIYSLSGDIAALYIQATYLEEKKVSPNKKIILELVEKAALEGQRPIQNLFFETEKDGWDYINLMNKEYQIAQHIYNQIDQELQNQLVFE